MQKIQVIVIVAAFLAVRAVAQDGADAVDITQSSAESQTPAQPQAAEAPEGSDGVKTLAGMSILGNEEAPKALVIVPWKSSQIGDGVGVTDAMDGRPRPVDKEVFMREVHYYGLRSGAQE